MEAWCREFVRRVDERGGICCSSVEVGEIKGNEVEVRRAWMGVVIARVRKGRGSRGIVT